ncbi:MAG TPA: hypothetical protein VF219_19565 [Vicinamibacterales bacterium]
MKNDSHTWLGIVLISSVLAGGPRVAAQAPPAAPTTAVMASLTVKAEADRAQVMRVLPDEVRATVKLYLDGKIQQWFSRSDGRGVLFIMNCSTVAEAKALMDELPLSKANLVNLEYTALGPLTPLRALIAAPPAGGAQNNP